MTGAEIRKERKRLKAEMDKLDTRKDVLLARLDGLRGQCEHLKPLKTSHTGEPCRDCPDCGACGI